MGVITSHCELEYLTLIIRPRSADIYHCQLSDFASDIQANVYLPAYIDNVLNELSRLSRHTNVQAKQVTFRRQLSVEVKMTVGNVSKI